MANLWSVGTRTIPPNATSYLTMLQTNQIHHIDWPTALTEIDDKSVDCVLTSPPHPSGIGAPTEEQSAGIAALYAAARKTRNFIVFFWSPFTVPQPPPGWYEASRHIWHKPDARAILTYDVIVVWAPERKRKLCRVWNIPTTDGPSSDEYRMHPSHKPARLIRALIAQYARPGETVLDPFSGTGSVAQACKEMRRNFIAIERDEELAAASRERLAAPPRPQELGTYMEGWQQKRRTEPRSSDGSERSSLPASRKDGHVPVADDYQPE